MIDFWMLSFSLRFKIGKQNNFLRGDNMGYINTNDKYDYQ